MATSIRASLIVLAAALSFAGGRAMAQATAPIPGASQVYRIVGPDGRITFSDRAPKDPGMHTSLAMRQAASGAVVLPPPVTAITPWNSLSADARRGIVPAVPVGETLSSPSVITVALVDALSGVLARVELVQTMRLVCVRNMPAAAASYDDAARRWRERNAAVVARTDRVMEFAFDGPPRNKLQATAHTRLAPILTALASASTEAKLQWCDQAAEAISHGALDTQGPAGIGAPVMNYTPRE
jgi:hypothetical protein